MGTLIKVKISVDHLIEWLSIKFLDNTFALPLSFHRLARYAIQMQSEWKNEMTLQTTGSKNNFLLLKSSN